MEILLLFLFVLLCIIIERSFDKPINTTSKISIKTIIKNSSKYDNIKLANYIHKVIKTNKLNQIDVIIALLDNEFGGINKNTIMLPNLIGYPLIVFTAMLISRRRKTQNNYITIYSELCLTY